MRKQRNNKNIFYNQILMENNLWGREDEIQISAPPDVRKTISLCWDPIKKRSRNPYGNHYSTSWCATGREKKAPVSRVAACGQTPLPVTSSADSINYEGNVLKGDKRQLWGTSVLGLVSAL